MKSNGENKTNLINFESWGKKKLSTEKFQIVLQKPEEAILKEIKEEISNARILDIGVGTGRTIEFLGEISRNYVGIDYSQERIVFCKRKFPGFDLRCCDARNMSIFKDEEFAFILFSYNGIDYVSHNDRLHILQEIDRVLKKGGLFAFSSHNKGVYNFSRFPFDWPQFALNPIVLLRNIQKIGVRLLNHFKNRRFEFHSDKYSIINDPGANYSLMTYYIDIDYQIRQLRQIGFEGPVKIYGFNGEEGPDYSQSPWIYYLARK